MVMGLLAIQRFRRSEAREGAFRRVADVISIRIPVSMMEIDRISRLFAAAKLAPGVIMAPLTGFAGLVPRPCVATAVMLTIGSLIANPASGESPVPVVSTMRPDEVRDFSKNPVNVQALLATALELTTRGLGYKLGSADPGQGGMDCSGTVYHLLRRAGVTDVPRSSHEQYRWAWESGQFRAVNSRTFDSFEFRALRPGDLLFWTGTYEPKVKRDPPISHVMIYLGRAKSGGRPLMIGSSDGRPFEGKPQCGVSVFDFRLPSENSAARFVGYSPVPGLPPASASLAATSPADADARIAFVGPPWPPPENSAATSKKRKPSTPRAANATRSR